MLFAAGRACSGPGKLACTFAAKPNEYEMESDRRRVFTEPLVECVFKPETLHQAEGAALNLRGGQMIDLAKKRQIFFGLHALVESMLLRQNADMRPNLSRLNIVRKRTTGSNRRCSTR